MGIIKEGLIPFKKNAQSYVYEEMSICTKCKNPSGAG